jgi:murein tripeptide amidase MpaA
MRRSVQSLMSTFVRSLHRSSCSNSEQLWSSSSLIDHQIETCNKHRDRGTSIPFVMGAPLLNTSFESANGDLERLEVLSNDRVKFSIAIQPDVYCESDHSSHSQWFHFQCCNVRSRAVTVEIVNAGEASFPKAWNGYNVCCSYDGREWFRHESTYQDKVLRWTILAKYDNIYFSYFAPYGTERRQSLSGSLQKLPGVSLTVLGYTHHRRPIELLHLTDHHISSSDSANIHRQKIWVIARQHPGETMAEWFTEGLLRRLVDDRDAVAQNLRKMADFYIVPCMCPDGAAIGHLRTNAVGANLNREWSEPDKEISPEVFYVRQKMMDIGVDAFVDVYGDMKLPYAFFVGNEGIPSWNDTLRALQNDFSLAFLGATPDFQTRYGYGVSSPGKANLKLASKWVGEHFKCVSVTLEMPFKDAANNPEPIHGWSPERSMKLGGDMLVALQRIQNSLR